MDHKGEAECQLCSAFDDEQNARVEEHVRRVLVEEKQEIGEQNLDSETDCLSCLQAHMLRDFILKQLRETTQTRDH